MDSFGGICGALGFMIAGGSAHKPLFDEDISMSSFRGVAVSDRDDSSCTTRFPASY